MIAWLPIPASSTTSGAQVDGFTGGLSGIAVRCWLGLQSPEGIFSHRPDISAGMADTAEGWLGLLPFTQSLHETSLDFHAARPPHDCWASPGNVVSPK